MKEKVHYDLVINSQSSVNWQWYNKKQIYNINILIHCENINFFFSFIYVAPFKHKCSLKVPNRTKLKIKEQRMTNKWKHKFKTNLKV